MKVRIVRSRRRTRTVSARLVRDTLLVRAPENLPAERVEAFVTRFKERIRRRRLAEEMNRDDALDARARLLAARYLPPALPPFAAEYSPAQESIFGCCDRRAGRIRVSYRVRTMPRWVRDYVIIHELAHLLVPGHGRPFRDLVSRYPLAERARGFLIGAGMRRETPGPASCARGGPVPGERIRGGEARPDRVAAGGAAPREAR
ncbi:MAG TPA: M48 family metallopeptidase [bacterium]|nr:M48 family metallopeptidase [bacterium]HQM51666.1 M48 family metallopeptidase [bacterium]